ncbi:ubiquitin carboxyl-terminal hydrolase-domain-containing protein [Cercophora scortea]|uniref:PAN2-PAN3 deadenylation complex catalytic subunit PAN2 n=1 Tax=Cercophora scortea TaxID=314031 RepID=A0AAE0IVV8_9PEZI|nr:ubiquitin carboxyl-terminal hydrolase-domain-containing protein [Cercophora scortea]
MDADWAQVTTCVAFPAPPGSNGYPRRPTAIAFDVAQELLWVGSEMGRVTSFSGRDLQRYTSFRIHPDSEGPVHQILFHDKGVIILGSRSVHMAMRRGPALWNIRHDDMTALRCMSFTSKGASEIVVAGWQDTMLVIDVNKGEVVKTVPAEHHYSTMKKSRYICAATKSGIVDIIDPVTLKVAKTWKAHLSYINDMDAQNDFIVTCGGSVKQQAAQVYMLDPYVNVFDLKNMASMKPMPFPPLAAHVRLHPRMLTTSIVVSQQAQMHVVDLMNPNTSNVRYANITSPLSMFEIAPSGEALVLVDSECQLHLWGSPSKIHFTDLGAPAELPEPEERPPVLDWSPDTPLSSVGMPYYRELLFSAWPAGFVSDVGAPPPQVDPAFLATLKQVEWGYYGPNTKKNQPRNQVADTRSMGKASNALKPPKFLSEKARETSSSSYSASARAMSDIESERSNGEIEGLKLEAPPMYWNCEIKYSKFGIDDFDFAYFNQTCYAGLENNVSNSYANSLIQLMNYTPLLRNMALQHAATACLVDPCMLCEMGYVFDMLQKAEGSTCQATNMLKALVHSPQALSDKLLEDEGSGQSLAAMVQKLCKFLLDSISQEYRSIPAASTALEQSLFNLGPSPDPDDLVSRILTTSAVTAIKCTNCRSEYSRPGNTCYNDLMYPVQKPTARGVRAPQTTFSQVLKMGVERETTTKGWCNRCSRYQTLQTRKTIKSVPAVLALNTAITTPEQKKLWATPRWLPEEIGIIVDQGQFFCYEGQDLQLHLLRGAHDIAVYSLVGLVVNIESGKPLKSHLVSMVNLAHSDPTPPNKSRWHMFNDFTVRAISTGEALTLNATWKTPTVLMYHLKTANNKSSMDWKANLDTSILFADFRSESDAKTYHVLNQQTEKPGPETIIALDTEFVSLKQPEIHMNSDGERETIRPMSHALARVSVIRGQGEEEGTAFIDDYIAIREPIVNYLTLYSGITPEDLDPRTTKHNLVSLKIAYKKLWVLLNLGCKFLGHGLRQDFRVINIQVPRAQIIDTIEKFYLKARLRKLSLAFLAWYLLKEDIQLETHDSIEDARTALKLYRKYLEFEDAGILDLMLEDIYRAGRATNFKPQRRDDQVVQRTLTPPLPMEGGPGGGPVTPTPATGKRGGGFVVRPGFSTPGAGKGASPMRD